MGNGFRDGWRDQVGEEREADQGGREKGKGRDGDSRSVRQTEKGRQITNVRETDTERHDRKGTESGRVGKHVLGKYIDAT